jgi:cytosine/adenosine deaminase-related metal-dependent hydrolase
MEEISDAIERADREMYEGGIVAVGDISNKADTAICKEKSPLRYYTFVEMFDFLQDHLADSTFDRYYDVFRVQSSGKGNRKSCVPHAPYTVSPTLFKRINQANDTAVTVSIHNQETPHENELFRYKTGGFKTFLEQFGFSLDHFSPRGENSIFYTLEHLRADTRALFVHNTLTSREDIEAAQRWNPQVYWATCPNANLYIENRLPNYQIFIDAGAKVTIGTDSLTSNWQLSILEEMKTILRYQSYVPFHTVLRWATLHGAEALGFEEDLGSIEAGKTPGLLLLDIGPDFRLDASTQVRRLI